MAGGGEWKCGQGCVCEWDTVSGFGERGSGRVKTLLQYYGLKQATDNPMEPLVT